MHRTCVVLLASMDEARQHARTQVSYPIYCAVPHRPTDCTLVLRQTNLMIIVTTFVSLGRWVVTETLFHQLNFVHVHIADPAAPFVGGVVPPSGLSASYSPSHHSMPIRPSHYPPCGPPPSFPQPSASAPPSHLSAPFSHFSPPQPSSLYNPTHQTAPGLTSRPPSGTPQPGLQDRQPNSHATIPTAKMNPNLQILCVPLPPVGSALSHLSSGSCGPMLKYDTVVNGIWYGACMIVSAYQSHEAIEFH